MTDAEKDYAMAVQPRKRVLIACDYCREKRLKCTANQTPCMNCQLYGSECKKSNDSRARRAAKIVSREMRERQPPSSRSPFSPNSTKLHSVLASIRSNLNGSGQYDPTQRNTDRNEAAHKGIYDKQVLSSEFEVLPDDLGFLQQLDSWEPTLSTHDGGFADGLFDATSLLDMWPEEAQELQTDSDLSHWNLADSSLITQNNMGNQNPHITPVCNKQGKISGIQSLNSESQQPPFHSQLLPGVFVGVDRTKYGFIGRHSIGATLAFCIRDAQERGPGLPKPAFNWLSKAASYVDEAGDPGVLTNSSYELPPKALARPSIAAYFKHVHSVYPFLNKESFQSGWEDVYDQPLSSQHIWAVLSLCLVVAIGAVCDRTSTQVPGQIERVSNALYERVWTVSDHAIRTSNVESVQVLLLHVIFLLHRGKISAAWTLCGLAIRASQALGLHRKVPHDFEVSEGEVRLRSQIWWITFSLDASCSMAQGRPPATIESDCDVEVLPLVEHKDDAPSSAAIQVSDLYRWRVKLAKIENRLCRVLTSCEKLTKRLNEIADIDNALIRWRDDLPIDCRPEQEILVHREMYELIALLHLEYFNVMRALHWASITCVRLRVTTESQLSPRICASEAFCLAAARSFVKILNDIEDETGRRSVFSITLHTDQYMAALAILYRNIFRNPKRTSSKADLEHFRAAKDYLERDLFHENYEASLSATLKELFDEMLSSAENLINPRSSPK